MSQNNTENSLAALGAWAGLLAKPEVEGLWYNDKELKLDGYKFISCRFDNCRLHISTTNFILKNCVIDESTVIVYGTDIVKPIQLFNARFDWIYKSSPLFAPTRNADGTISIGI